MKYFTIIFLSLALGCSSKKEKKLDNLNKNLITIDIISSLSDKQTIDLSTLVEDISYIPLEYSQETLMRRMQNPHVYADSLILIKAFKRIALFDMKNGKYLRDIGHFGEGPNEYNRSSMTYFGLIEPGSTLAMRKQYFIEYSLKSGKIISNIKKPQYKDKIPFKNELAILAITTFGDDLFLGYINNFNGNQPYKLVLFNREGQIIRLFKNHQSFVDTPTYIYIPTEGSFYHYHSGTYFKEDFNDTLFLVKKNELIPKYYFELGAKSPPYSEKEVIRYKDRKNYIFVKDIFETDHHLLFNVNYGGFKRFGIYDKELQKTVISDSPFANSYNEYGLKNDIDNFISFYPKVVQGNYILGLTSAEDVYNWFQNNYDKVNILTENLKKLKNISPEENPVVMIGKLK